MQQSDKFDHKKTLKESKVEHVTLVNYRKIYLREGFSVFYLSVFRMIIKVTLFVPVNRNAW